MSNTKVTRQAKRDYQLSSCIAESFTQVERMDRFNTILVFGQMTNGRYGVLTATDNSSRVEWLGFYNITEMETWIIQKWNSLLIDIEDAIKSAEARAAGHTLKVGDTLYTSWGYDQTNVSFYRVVAVPSKHRVDVVEIDQTVDVENMSSGRTYPGLKVIGKVERKPARENRVVNIDGRDNSGYFYAPDRKGVYCSWDR